MIECNCGAIYNTAQNSSDRLSSRPHCDSDVLLKATGAG